MQSKKDNRKAAVGRRRGMAMLAVLFVVMAIAVIAMGFIARADMSLASGQNLCRRTQTEYTALAGLEHARALLLSPDNTTPLETWQDTVQTETDTNVYYDLTIENPQVSGDPNSPQYLYPVQCQAYYQSGGQKRAASDINASILYTPSTGAAVYRSMSRQ
jgi:type II secretory pathway pseudopilin PulG